MRPTKTQIRLRMCVIWSESSLSAWRNFASLTIQNAPIEDSDQTARMRRLIWILAGRICPNRRYIFFRWGSYTLKRNFEHTSKTAYYLKETHEVVYKSEGFLRLLYNEGVINLNISVTCLAQWHALSMPSSRKHAYIILYSETGVYRGKHYFYYFAKKHRGGSNEYPQSMFWEKIWNISNFFIWKFSFFWL